jgi:hypothetical protein
MKEELNYESKSDRTRITANEIKFLRRRAGYTKLDNKRNTETLRELKIQC